MYLGICISYNTPLSDMAGIYARCPSVCTARGRSVYIPPDHDKGVFLVIPSLRSSAHIR